MSDCYSIDCLICVMMFLGGFCIFHDEERDHQTFRRRVAEGYNDTTPTWMKCMECGKEFENRADSWRHTEERLEHLGSSHMQWVSESGY